jgi:hypothetical protein
VAVFLLRKKNDAYGSQLEAIVRFFNFMAINKPQVEEKPAYGQCKLLING